MSIMQSAMGITTETEVLDCKIIPLPPLLNTEEVYYRYSDMVYRLALARCKSRPDAEDILQDVFMRYVRRNPTFDSSEHQRAWMIRTTINCSNSFLSSTWRKNTTELTDDIPETMQEESDVYAAVLRLPKQQRTAIHLFYYEGYHIDEIAALMESNQSTVKSWLRRARERLEKDLKGDYFDV